MARMTTNSVAPLGIQLYSFRAEGSSPAEVFGLDRGLLESLASIGYVGVETIDVPGGDPVAARRALDHAGLAVTSSHTGTALSDLDAVARTAADLAAIGSPRMIVSGRRFATQDDLERFADELNAAAEIAGRHGLTLGCHTHDGEMQNVDGAGPAYLPLRDRFDPRVAFQVDIFWVSVAGHDPARVVADLGDRVASLHLKDGVTLPSTASADVPFVNVAVGSGRVDPAPVIAAASPTLEWLIVEFDHTERPVLDEARASFEFLTEAGLARGRSRT